MQRAWFGGLLLGIGVFLGAEGFGQTREPRTPTIAIDSLVGSDSFNLYCAACHGATGRGDGPVAPALRTRPADLTLLSQRNNGTFPRERVRGFIEGSGRTLPAHGTNEMPVWGPMFRMFEANPRVRERLENLVTFVDSLQRRPGGSDAGAQAFRTYCASCHGTSGRGDGPMAGQLRLTPPDLTKFSARNGGVFPSARLERIIDGRDVASHGDPAMPVWGDAFRRTREGLSDDDVKNRIAAIVRYLEGIQEARTE